MGSQAGQGVASRRVGLLQSAAGAVVLLAAAPLVDASSTATCTFTVQAVINSACNVSATTLNFGAYNPGSATALTGTSTVSVYCTGGSPYSAALIVVTGCLTFCTRTLLYGSSTLNFNLYR